MKVRCVSEQPTAQQALLLGRYFHAGRQVFPVARDREYTVFGLLFLGGQAWVELATEFEQLVSAPLLLFEVVDPQIPSVWAIRTGDDRVALLPEALHNPDYYQALAEGDSKALAQFRALRAQLERD